MTPTLLYQVLDAFPEGDDVHQVALDVLGGNHLAVPKLAEMLKERKFENMVSIKIGGNYLIRTVTHYYTGKVVEKTHTDLVLSEAAWIPDTGRFHECLKKGTLAEVEPYPDTVIVSCAAIVDAAPWTHPLPRTAK